MKKSKIAAVGLIGLLMAGGLVLAGCGGKGSCADVEYLLGSCEAEVSVLEGVSIYGGHSCTSSSCAVFKAAKNPPSLKGDDSKRIECDC